MNCKLRKSKQLFNDDERFNIYVLLFYFQVVYKYMYVIFYEKEFVQLHSIYVIFFLSYVLWWNRISEIAFIISIPTEKNIKILILFWINSTEYYLILKGVIRICKLKDRQHNGQKKNYKGSTKHTHKTKNRVTQTPLKTSVNSGNKFLKATNIEQNSTSIWHVQL